MKRPWNKPTTDKEWVQRATKPFEGAKRYSNIYNQWRWRKASKNFLRHNPLCNECAKNGYITEAKIVDHIVPIADGCDPWDETNWQSLCARCHQRKSNKEIAARKKSL